MSTARQPFEIAQTQLDEAAQLLGLDPSMTEFLRWPMREFHFSVPVRMDDGRTRVFRGYRVQYNDARGPTKGGLRWHRDESPNIGRATAAWMTWKTAVMDIPQGGAAGGIICDPKTMTPAEKERMARGWMRVMARTLGEHMDVPEPDLYTTPQIMAWMMDEYEVIMGRAHPAVVTGKPLELGGSQGRNDATARGGVYAVREACKKLKIDPTGTFAVQGFGNVGRHVALLHSEILGGGKLIAVSDTGGGVRNPAGLDVPALIEHKRRTGSVSGFPGATHIDKDELLELDVDVLYPAAMESALTERNAERVRARVCCELANGPTTPEADRILHVKGVHVIPDLLANAGGMTVSYFEQVQDNYNYFWSMEEVCRQLEERMVNAYEHVFEVHKERKAPMRMAAYLVGVRRVADAVRLRGWA